MKVQITMRATNNTINALAKCLDSSIESISAYDSTISFEVEDAGEWLTPERKIAFEEVYNKEMSVCSNPSIYFIVDKISVSN